MTEKIRYWLIIKLAGNMPVVLNMNIARPNGFEGCLAEFPRVDLPRIFHGNVLWHKQHHSLLTPHRDVSIRQLREETSDEKII